MSKRAVNEHIIRPYRLRLPYIGSEELKNIRVAIKRNLPQGGSIGPLIRSLDNAQDLILHRPGEGQKPIFDRDDIIVNLDFEERVVVTSPHARPISKSEERLISQPRTRKSRSHSRKRSPERKYYNRSRSRSADRTEHHGGSFLKEEQRSKVTTTVYRGSGEQRSRDVEDHKYDGKDEASSSLKSRRRRSLSKERRRSSSRDREHSKYNKSPPRSESYHSSRYESERRLRRTPSPPKHDYKYRKYSKSPTRKRETTYRDQPHYSKSQERRSRSPYRDRDSKHREYRKRTRSPYTRGEYKSPHRKERRERSKSPPRYRAPMDPSRRHNPVPYQIPPHYGGPWPIYEPLPPYVKFVIPEGFIPAPPRFPANIPIRPRMPVRLPIYNNRPIPKIKDASENTLSSSASSSSTALLSTLSIRDVTVESTQDSISKSSSTEYPDTVNVSRESVDSGPIVTTTQEIVKLDT